MKHTHTHTLRVNVDCSEKVQFLFAALVSGCYHSFTAIKKWKVSCKMLPSSGEMANYNLNIFLNELFFSQFWFLFLIQDFVEHCEIQYLDSLFWQNHQDDVYMKTCQFLPPGFFTFSLLRSKILFPIMAIAVLTNVGSKMCFTPGSCDIFCRSGV